MANLDRLLLTLCVATAIGCVAIAIGSGWMLFSGMIWPLLP